MNNRSLLCLLFLWPAVGSFADERVRSTQEELRRRNVYFGDVDGRPSRELEEALKRYQSKKGLSATGHEDRETLRSLGLVTRGQDDPPPKELEWPEEPVLKSDARLDVVAAAEEVSTTGGVSMTSLVPNRTASGARRRTDRRGRLVDPHNSQPAGKAPGQSPRFSLGQKDELQRQLTTYIRDYLRAVGHNRLEDELHFYADRVDYLGNGVVDRRIIEQSLRRYYQRWPKRSYAQIGAVAYRANPARGEIAVSFQTEFSLGGSKSRVKGRTLNQVVINAATADPRIVSITEQRLRR